MFSQEQVSSFLPGHMASSAAQQRPGILVDSGSTSQTICPSRYLFFPCFLKMFQGRTQHVMFPSIFLIPMALCSHLQEFQIIHQCMSFCWICTFNKTIVLESCLILPFTTRHKESLLIMLILSSTSLFTVPIFFTFSFSFFVALKQSI